ncbi:MAG: AI-2E family transporter [Agriterribacter sp.]
MPTSTSNLLSVRINQALLMPILATVILYFGKPVLIPLFFSILLAMLMAPVCRRLDEKKFPRWLSCAVCIAILLVTFLLLIAIIVMQLSDFLKDLNLIEQKTGEIWTSVKQQIEAWFNISPQEQEAMVQNQMTEIKKSPAFGIGKVAGGITGILAGLAIVLVFTFLLLYHKEKYERFFLKLYAGQNKEEVKEVLTQITHVSQKYLTGRILSMLFLFVLYAIALLIIGIKNALLLAAIASLLTVVPYLGPIVGGLFPFMTALVTEDSLQPALWVLISLIVIQTIDNYLVEPNVIGGEVSLTALSTIIAIFLGGIIWGIAGMILFIPMLSIAKIIFDHVEKLKPYGYVVGDDGESPSHKLLNIFKRKK